MKLRRNGLIGKLKNKINDFIFEHEPIDTAVGKIREFIYDIKNTEKGPDNFNNNGGKVSIVQTKVYIHTDYEYLLELVSLGYTVIIDISFLKNDFRDRFLFGLKKGLFELGTHFINISENAIICSFNGVDIIQDNKQKRLGKIIKFPYNK